MVTAGILPFGENSQGRTRIRARGLMISKQRLWPLDHEAGRMEEIYVFERVIALCQTTCHYIQIEPRDAQVSSLIVTRFKEIKVSNIYHIFSHTYTNHLVIKKRG